MDAKLIETTSHDWPLLLKLEAAGDSPVVLTVCGVPVFLVYPWKVCKVKYQQPPPCELTPPASMNGGV